MDEDNPNKREKNLSLTSRLNELSEEDKSIQNSGTMEEEILANLNTIYKDFHKFYLAIENSKQIELKKSFYKNAIRYAHLRAQWFLVDREEREIMHEERRSAHNVFIDMCNIMSRNMIKNGEDASWRRELRDDRKVIGDFACYINYVLGIKAR